MALPWAFFLSLLVTSSEAQVSFLTFCKYGYTHFSIFLSPMTGEKLSCLFRRHIGLQQDLHSLHERRRGGTKVVFITVIIIIIIAIIVIIIIAIIIIIISPPGLPVWIQKKTNAK